MRFFHLAISLSLFASVKSASLSIFASKTDLKEGDNVTITTQVTFLPGEELTFIKWVNNQNVALASALTADWFAVLPNGKSIFSDRISASYQSSAGYLIKLTNLRANDSMNLTIVLEYRKPTEKTYGEVYQSLFIDVKADPVILSFPEVLFVNEGNELFVESTIYGRPKPSSNIVYGDQAFNAYNFFDFSNNTYKYFYNLSAFYANSCGSVLLLNVFGNGVARSRSVTVLVQFIPGFVRLSSPVVQLENYFIYLNWNSIPSGTCPVTYNIEFLSNTNQIVNQFYGINTTSFSAANNANATVFRIYAVYNGTPGPALNLTIPPPRPTTTTITKTTTAVKTTSSTVTMTTTAVKTTSSNPANVSTIVGIAVGVSAIFVGLLVASYFLGFYRHKKLSKVKKEVNKDNGYQELVMRNGNMGYQKSDAVNSVNENNTSLPNIDYQNIAVSESNYNYVDPKFS
ncbi:uncharacterized protein LOC136075452 [Hydra vulgaris]|uniref:Uncharacterized protein LOC136075452 n=1 Tax=Hydra vulgaris TaxID=6087 RepID=A0ABM4B7E2_HYDVU